MIRKVNLNLDTGKPILWVMMMWLIVSLACGPAVAPQPTNTVLVIPATNTPVTPTDTPLPATETVMATVTPVPPTVTYTPLPTDTPMATPNPQYVVVRLFPSHGDLQSQLAIEAQNAAVLGLKPFIEFEASW